jgi:GAF domain-containing protein
MNRTSPQPNIQSAIFDYGKWREEFIQSILIGAAIFGFIALVANFLIGASTTDLTIYSTTFIVLLLAILFRLPYWLKAGVFLTLIYALAISGYLETGIWGDSRLFTIALVIIACLLLTPLAGVIVTVLGTITTVTFGWLILTLQYRLTNHVVPMGNFSDWLTATLTDILLSVVIIIGLRLVHGEFQEAREQAGSALLKLQEESAQLELRVEERTNQLSQKSELLRSAAFIARNIAELQDVPLLLERTVRWASELFGLHHVAIYLFDDQRKVAFLQAASSESGKRMLENGFHIESSSRNIVGQVAGHNKSYIITEEDVNSKSRLTSEGKLDTTKTQVVMPLTVRGRIIGIMDFQSKEPRTFSPDEIEILQSMADQIAISINSVHLINETQAFAGEMESLTSEQTKIAWRNYFSNRELAFEYTPSETKAVVGGQGRIKNENELQIPLRLRGQSIGAISFRGKENSEWSEGEQSLAERVAEQVALALENSRLIEETRQRAVQQQTVNEISARLNRSLNMDTLLQSAARELGSLPDVAEVSVFIQPSDGNE